MTWNHNVQYEPVILRAVPAGCGPALDVGCGDGRLVRQLVTCCAMVTGIDPDEPMITLARSQCGGNAVFINADFLSYPFKEESFDFACANTSLHHMDLGQALEKMAALLRPGGTLAVVGIARDATPADYLRGSVAVPVNVLYKATRGETSPAAPVRDPELTWREARTIARAALPGVRYRRHLLWRYSLLWRKPG